jgi:L-seryl-tRNA(Ser) seleniumtransferase
MMARFLTRRDVLRKVGLFPLAASWMTSERVKADVVEQTGSATEVYRRLGVRRIINAMGFHTHLSGSLMPPEVIRAMEEASQHFVRIDDLQRKVGERLAELTGAEAALVTAGAAAAITLGTAACMTGKDDAKIKRLPDTTGMKNEVIVQKAHRNPYDHAVRATGARLVEVETLAEYRAAFNSKTAMVYHLVADRHFDSPEGGRIALTDALAVAREHGVPYLVDAAAELPPLSNLTYFTRLGVDLVCFSGGKGLMGPQCSGMLLGRRDLIEAAYLNGSPHSDSIGRAAKVGKEEIIGLLVALELYLQRDHQAQWKEWQQQVAFILQSVADVPGVTKAEMFVPPIANETPHARIQWDEKVIPLKQRDVARRLLEGEPSIAVRPSPEDAPVVEVAVWMLQPGEYQIVARCIREVLTKGA